MPRSAKNGNGSSGTTAAAAMVVWPRDPQSHFLRRSAHIRLLHRNALPAVASTPASASASINAAGPRHDSYPRELSDALAHKQHPSLFSLNPRQQKQDPNTIFFRSKQGSSAADPFELALRAIKPLPAQVNDSPTHTKADANSSFNSLQRECVTAPLSHTQHAPFRGESSDHFDRSIAQDRLSADRDGETII